ncbi:unnamed protein product [Ectocarpus sp. 8 AP-2014]
MNPICAMTHNLPATRWSLRSSRRAQLVNHVRKFCAALVWKDRSPYRGRNYAASSVFLSPRLGMHTTLHVDAYGVSADNFIPNRSIAIRYTSNTLPVSSTNGPKREKPVQHIVPHAKQVLGDFIGTIPDVRRILNGLKAEGFAEGEYDVVRNNCNHFCDEFAFALTGRRIPPWVNRAATIGTWAGLGETKKEGANDKNGGAGTAASSATASAPPSRDRKELTQKQRDLLSKMRTNKSSGGGGRGGAGGAT